MIQNYIVAAPDLPSLRGFSWGLQSEVSPCIAYLQRCHGHSQKARAGAQPLLSPAKYNWWAPSPLLALVLLQNIPSETRPPLPQILFPATLAEMPQPSFTRGFFFPPSSFFLPCFSFLSRVHSSLAPMHLLLPPAFSRQHGRTQGWRMRNERGGTKDGGLLVPKTRVIKALTHKSVYVCLYMLCLRVLDHGQNIWEGISRSTWGYSDH